MRQIHTLPVAPDVSIRVPGSKSHTHRLMIASALSDGVCRIGNPLHSEDTWLTKQALEQMGIRIDEESEAVRVHGGSGRLAPCAEPIHLGNSGTSMRLLCGVAVLGRGEYRFTGSPRLCERPMQALLDALNQIGVPARSQKGSGCPPIIVPAGGDIRSRAVLDCSTSSQYLSALLLAAPCLPRGLIIDVSKGPVSRPYIDLTLDIMSLFEISFTRDGYTHFEIAANQSYSAGDHQVEPDASQAGYFWAAGAVSGARIKVQGVLPGSRQGDVGLAGVFAQMGCRVDYEKDGIAVQGGDLHAVEVDMGHMPDMVPTLAVVAAFARGTTVMRNVAHLRAKESDRLAAVSQELNRMGIETHCGPDELRVTGGTLHGAEIQTYNDHRIAMAFAVAGLKVPGVVITDETCVGKSFPNFWEVFEGLYEMKNELKVES
jgi:3-phosphoshikimate 1-carboxyvinyltransferase